MTSVDISLQEWLGVMAEVAGEVAAASLGYEGCRVLGECQQPPEDKSGAYIPILSGENALQLALISDACGGQQLAKALLGMDSKDEDLSPADVADAVGEIMNVVAGGVKRRLIEKDSQLQLGLPIFVHGYIEVMEMLEWAVMDVNIGSVPAHFMVIRHRVNSRNGKENENK